MTVPMATVIFIDIVKFSTFSIALSPQQILGTLSGIIEAYDRRIADYKSLTKIKVIGDTYMCAGGLFNDEPTPEKDAYEIVKFGFEALQAIDDQNLKMNMELKVRIGVNTGGPLITGVLGTDKVQFDIIGDPINIAARLQSTGEPGKIHISEETRNLLQGHNFVIEERGLTFLKGKGKKKTYQIVEDEQ